MANSMISLTNILFYPLLLLFGGGVACRTFVNILLALEVYSSTYSSNNIIEAIRPVLKQLNIIAEHLFGKIHKEQIKLMHILLAAILIALICILNSLAVERKEKKKKEE